MRLVLALLFFAVPSRAIGAGDVKMAGLVGAIAGVPDVFGPLLLAAVAAGLAAGILQVTRHGASQQLMPYGPFLALGGTVSLL